MTTASVICAVSVTAMIQRTIATQMQAPTKTKQAVCVTIVSFTAVDSHHSDVDIAEVSTAVTVKAR